MQTQTINISLPIPLVKRVDLLAKESYSSRSDLIREVLLEKLRQREEWRKIFTAGRRAARRLGIKNEKKVDEIVYEFRHGKRPS